MQSHRGGCRPFHQNRARLRQAGDDGVCGAARRRWRLDRHADGAHAEANGGLDVLDLGVADHQARAGRAACKLDAGFEHGRVGLAEANVERSHDGVDQVCHIQIVEIAPVLRRSAHLHVADHDAAQPEAADSFEELACAWKQCDARRSRRAQRAADLVETSQRALRAEVKIVASSGFSPEKCKVMAVARAPIDVVGTGSYLPDNWSETYATADIIAYDGEPMIKVGREFLLRKPRRAS